MLAIFGHVGSSNRSQKLEVTISDLITTDVSASVSEACLQLVHVLAEKVNAGLTGSFVGIILHYGIHLGFFNDINGHTLHPLDFVEN